ncbi:MAG: aminopeptidase P family protein [Prevotellaceae bacterium]|jgi:Xaa-Pro aminopeptidase|nr:aminopeptidase P family protein [Prevotellaceae bacterium]
MFTQDIYINRRNSLRKLLPSGVILLLGHDEAPLNYAGNTYRFRQDSNFLYFFGLSLPGMAGVIDIEEGTDCLYGNDMDIEDIIWNGSQPSMQQLAAKAGVGSVASLKDLKIKLQLVIRQGRKIHFAPPYRGETKIRIANLMEINPQGIADYVSRKLIRAIVQLRSEKEDCELAEIEKACNTGYEMHVQAMRMCRSGVYEYQIAGAIEGIAAASNGATSFPVILSQNSEILHNHSHRNVLQSGKMMITDAGAETASGYASDFTRTVPVDGQFNMKQRDIYEIVLAANNHAIETAAPDIPYFDVHISAAQIIAEGLKNLGLMTGNIDDAVQNGAHALFFPHGLGHMMGLDVHDMESLGEKYVGYDDEIVRSSQFGTAYLRFGRRLKKNFVLTVEPGIYFIPALIAKWEKEKINSSFINFDKVKEYCDFGGIRLEDNIVITDSGCRLLGAKRIPITPDEIANVINIS